MAFGAVNRFPNDTRPDIGIGVNLPFSEVGYLLLILQQQMLLKLI